MDSRRSRSTPGEAVWTAFALALIFGLMAAGPARAGTVSNPTSSHPIDVDGAYSSSTEYPTSTGSTGPLAYKSGSLYKTGQDDPNRTNEFVAVVAPVEQERGLFFCAAAVSSLVPQAVYAAGQKVADARFCATFNGSAPRVVTLMVRGSRNTKNGPFEYFADVTGDGISDGAASRFGILAAAGFGLSSLNVSTPHLVLELAVPLEGNKAVFCSGRVAVDFYLANGTSISVSDSLVSLDTLGTTTATSDYVPSKIQIDVGNYIDLKKNGLVPVTIPSDALFDAMTVNPASVVVRDSRLPTDFLSSFYTQGARPVKSNLRVNGNGRYDLVLWFASSDLAAPGPGGLDKTTQEIILAGMTFNGATISGKAPVRISP